MEILIHPVDVTIIVTYLLVTIWLGLRLGDRDGSTNSYFLGNK